MDHIQFLIDKVEIPDSMGMFEKGAGKSLDILIDMTSDKFQEKFSTLVGNVITGLSKISTDNEKFEIDEAIFSININSEGELSVMSIVKAGITNGTGIQVRLKKKTI